MDLERVMQLMADSKAGMNKKDKIFGLIIIAIASMVCIKSVLTDFGFDQAYTVAMSYRHIRGDRMLAEMWDPLQTSMFVTEALMRLYKLFVPSLTGLAIYLGICGTLLLALTGFVLYKELKEVTNEYAAFLSAVFFLVFRARISAFPDYINLSVIFSALTFVFIVKFIKNEKSGYLLLSAVFLSLQVLVYPSMALVLGGLIVILTLFSQHKVRNCLTLTLFCLLAGGLYVGFFVLKIGFGRFLQTVRYIISGDAHGGDYEGQLDKLAGIKSGFYFRQFLLMAGLALIIAALFWGIKLLCRRIARKEISILPYYVSALFVSEMIYMVFWKSKLLPEWCDFGYAIPLLLIIISAINYKKMDESRRKIWVSGITVSLCTFLGACLFSNMQLLYVLPFLVLGGVVSFVSIPDFKKGITALTIALCMALFKTGFYVGGYAQIASENTIRLIDYHNRTLKGPTAQLISTWIIADGEKRASEEFSEIVSNDDKVFYAGGWIFDPMMFLATGAEISNPNTTDTPFYGESINRYFEMNPQKYPTLVIVEMSDGMPATGEDSWIMNWIKEEGFEKCSESDYWNYYRKP